MERQENKNVDLKELYGIDISRDEYDFDRGFVQIKKDDYFKLKDRRFNPSFIGHFLNLGKKYAREETIGGNNYLRIRISAIPDFFNVKDKREKFYDLSEVTADLAYSSNESLEAKIREMELDLHSSGLIPRTTYDALKNERMPYLKDLREEEVDLSIGAYSN